MAAAVLCFAGSQIMSWPLWLCQKSADKYQYKLVSIKTSMSYNRQKLQSFVKQLDA